MKKTKYQVIADDIRSNILAGALKVSEAIPPELQLQKDYSVSRHTVREAISLLVNEGYLRKEKGSGTYVSDAYQTQSKHTSKKTIGVITTYLSDYIFPSIIRGIEKELSEQGYSLLLASTNNDTLQEKKSLEMMLGYGVDGLIVEPTKSNQYNPNLSYYLAFKGQNIPFVMINAHYEELAAPSIELDDVQSGYLATKELLDKGHTGIALITKIDDLQGKNRMKGYIKAFELERKVFASESIFTYKTESKDQMLKNVRKELLKKETAITGIVCYNDAIGLEIMELAKQVNLKIPDDLSLIGQDDSFVGTAADVKLTTISHPKEKMGRDAAKWIIEAIEGKNKFLDSIRYEPKLIQRESVAKLTKVQSDR